MTIPFGQSLAVGGPFITLVDDIVAVILAITQEGWEIARQTEDFKVCDLEVPFTERLRDGMRCALKRRGLKNMAVLPGTESKSNPSLRVPDGRTDIPIFVTDIFVELDEHDPHAVIECKRIQCNDSYLVREYVISGINRFCSGKYSPNHRYGFMVGYLLAGTESAAVAEINNYIKKHKLESESLGTYSEDFWKSDHLRKENGTISVLHSFLDAYSSFTSLTTS